MHRLDQIPLDLDQSGFMSKNSPIRSPVAKNTKRSGAGKHKTLKDYNRKVKHKKRY